MRKISKKDESNDIIRDNIDSKEVKEMDNVCVVFDFENIESSLQEKYKLSLTENGFKRILSYTEKHGIVKKKNILVGAYWDNYKSHKALIAKTGVKSVFVPLSIKNATDCSLIIEVMKIAKEDNLSLLKTFVILSGDGGYGSLIYYLHENDINVIIYSVKGCSKEELVDLANDHEWIEDILEIKDENNYNSKYLSKFILLPEWKAVVMKANSFTEMPYMDKNYLAKQVLYSCNRCNALKAYDNIEKCKKLVNQCCEIGLFIEGERTVSNGQKVTTVVVNNSHDLIKFL